VDRLGAAVRCCPGSCAVAIAVPNCWQQYPGPAVIRYQCGSNLRDPEATCWVSFGGLKADRLISEHVLECVKPLAVQASLQPMTGHVDMPPGRVLIDGGRRSSRKRRVEYSAGLPQVSPTNGVKR
jgi:hypothetical protein